MPDPYSVGSVDSNASYLNIKNTTSDREESLVELQRAGSVDSRLIILDKNLLPLIYRAPKRKNRFFNKVCKFFVFRRKAREIDLENLRERRPRRKLFEFGCIFKVFNKKVKQQDGVELNLLPEGATDSRRFSNLEIFRHPSDLSLLTDWDGEVA
ncbi:hypothetical protein FIV00_03670 [Labrenzia sp. THAF82]|uniref:hypothetical protein n=1 Tax=Labrenzia sp. THAF82 TaxID=2587861 RepID=UPI0012694D81|nr:hypothetical protein [Labrenzia sp. THAF82]QFT29568.1 hypothetical protein FIV00_03670 [Labrenzia sp. THAF82]